MSQLEPISILFLTFPKVAQAMWWVAQAMWSGLRRLCGGIQLHNYATLWPNLQERTCKNSSQVEFHVGKKSEIIISKNQI